MNAEPTTEAPVVCASCGRSKDQPHAEARRGREACTDPDWHQPQPYVPDVDVTAEDGDDLAPMTEDDLLAAVGPEPGKTWAELYARAALQLSYRTAQLNGAQRELDRLRSGGRQVVADIGGDSALAVAALIRQLDPAGQQVMLTQDELVAVQRSRVRATVEPATGAVHLEVVA